MTDEERDNDIKRWNTAIGEALTGVFPADGKGLIAVRVFYVIRHPDGTESAGNLGITPDNEMSAGVNLLGALKDLVEDKQDNRWFETRDFTKN